jgi:Mce-associated membrane protein
MTTTQGAQAARIEADRPRPRPAHVDAVPDHASVADVLGAPPSRRRHTMLVRGGMVLVGLLVLALAALNLWVASLRSDQHDINAARAAALASARTRVPAILSYDYRTIDADIEHAVANLTGAFRTDFRSLLLHQVKPAAVAKKIRTRATAVGTSAIDAHVDSVLVLVFLDQRTTSGTSATPQTDGSRVEVTMTKVHGAWLVSALTPV